MPLSNACISITGNAVRLSEDLARRFLVVDLDAKCENPEQRSFDQDFAEVISARRSELLGALLTIWRWGRQNRLARGMPMGSFEVWAAWCRDPLLALGCLDPARRIEDLKVQDPLRQRVFELFETWHAAHGSMPVKFCDLNSNVRQLVQGNNAQSQVAQLQALENTCAAGVILESIKPQGRWGKKKYVLRQHGDDGAIAFAKSRNTGDHRGHRWRAYEVSEAIACVCSRTDDISFST